MPKMGLLHDYDLMANAEESAKNNTCVICGSSPVRYQWSDYGGEAMCQQCGAPYQLKWGSEQQQKDGDYPYLNVKTEAIHILREYWEKTKRFTCFGQMLGNQPGLKDFYDWLSEAHPEMVK